MDARIEHAVHSKPASSGTQGIRLESKIGLALVTAVCAPLGGCLAAAAGAGAAGGYVVGHQTGHEHEEDHPRSDD